MAQITGPAIGSGGPVSGQEPHRVRKDAATRAGGSRQGLQMSRRDEVVLSRQAHHAVASSPRTPAHTTASFQASAAPESASTRSLDARGAQALSKKVSEAIRARPDGAAAAQANTGRDSAMAVLR